MAQQYTQLGIFSDWVDAARRQGPLYPEAAPGRETQRLVREVLGFCNGPEAPQNVRVEGRWVRDGVAGEEVSWSVGYGPRTHAYALKPARASEPLPGVLALHDHGMFKFYGKEKIADGPADPPPVLRAYRDTYYGGRAYANALAREGFVVLVPDTFLWGSRGFPLEVMLDQVGDDTAAVLEKTPPDADTPFEIARYNVAAAFHEHIASKYCNVLGTTMAGVVAHEDRIAVSYLLSRPDVLPGRAGCAGLSGGGNRTALLNATDDRIAAAAIVGLMSTYAGLLDHNISPHTWMFFPFGWARHGDWPDLAACRAPSPLLVQYDLDDDLFTPEGMAAAHERLTRIFAAAGAPEAYTGQFYPGPHRFDLAMQTAAFAWMKLRLK
jgi:dienelactone hydrolase